MDTLIKLGIGSLLGALIMRLVDNLFIKEREFKSRQWIIKREACLDALSAVDAMFSHINWINVPKQPTKQKVDISKIRECYSKLVLSCENKETVEKFLEIIFDLNKNKKQPTVLLNEFRILIRKELDLKSKIEINEEKAWIGDIVGDDK